MREIEGEKGDWGKNAIFCDIWRNNCGNIWKFEKFFVSLYAFALKRNACVLMQAREREAVIAHIWSMARR